jgi:hypothetical protein
MDVAKAMTVNERLLHFGLFDDFDAAVRANDLAALKKVLIEAQFTLDQAQKTAASVLANPALYGY